ncbi:hypothetical protein SDC9_151062 [bioreactor metagenome]|uniref:Uncharacterized protein n=1 Tax=bioreactor metagenome TaxID=1076179 RepID=A0A645EP94_9ZZZZ
MGGKARLDRIIHHFFVEDRQRARHTHAHRTALGVRLGAEGRGAAAEYFRIGLQLHMDLKSDDHFIVLIHFRSLPRFLCCSGLLRLPSRRLFIGKARF